MGMKTSEILAAIAAGGGNTFLDDAQYFYIDESLGSGAGPYEINTGIIPALTPNTYIIIRVESGMLVAGVNQDSGWRYWQTGWGASLPTLPAGLSVVAVTDSVGGINILGNQFNSWQLNASGELTLSINDMAPNEMWAALKIAVWIKVLPFAPTFVS